MHRFLSDLVATAKNYTFLHWILECCGKHQKIPSLEHLHCCGKLPIYGELENTANFIKQYTCSHVQSRLHPVPRLDKYKLHLLLKSPFLSKSVVRRHGYHWFLLLLLFWSLQRLLLLFIFAAEVFIIISIIIVVIRMMMPVEAWLLLLISGFGWCC
jgi:hypothetical protein